MGGPVLVVLDDDPDAPTARSRSATAHRRWWVAVVLVVALALVVGQVVADARERSRVAALARLPGVLAPQPDPPHVAWRLDDATVYVTVAGGTVVEHRVSPDGAMSLAARDTATGAERWTAPVLDAPDVPLGPGVARYGLQCTDGAGLPGRLVCLAHDATTMRTPDGRGANTSTASSTPATSATLVVVDLADGAVAARHPAGSDGTVAAAVGVVGDRVVLAAPLDDGTTVWAVDAATGEQRWRVHADTGFGGGWLRWGAEVRVLPVGDAAVAVLGAGVVLLDAADGTTTGTAGSLATVLGVRSDDSALVVASEGHTRLLRPGDDVRLDGSPVPVTVDDDSAPHLALTSSGGLRAWDATTGEARWRAQDVVGTQEALVVGGRVHVHDGSTLTTLDARTGEVLWQATTAELFTPGVRVTGLSTDGSHLLVDGLDAAAEQAGLVALDPGDGVRLWAADLPGVTHVATVDGLLLGRTADRTFVLR